MRRALSVFFVLMLGVFSSQEALAWDGIVSGTISRIDVVPAGNLELRVYMDQAQPWCAGSGVTWAYLNASASNYEASVAVLNSAFLAGKTVTLYLTTVGSYCEIGYIAMLR